VVVPRPLREVVAELQQVPLGDGFEEAPTIFASRPWTSEAQSVVLLDDAVNGVAATMPDFAYLLEVEIALEVLEVWSDWRGGATPSIDQAVEAIVHYATHDAYLSE